LADLAQGGGRLKKAKSLQYGTRMGWDLQKRAFS